MLRVLFYLMVVGLISQSCVKSKAKEIQVVTADEVKIHKQYNVQKDVELRSKNDFKKSNLINAEHLLSDESSRKALGTLEKDAPIALYYTSKNKTKEAAELLHDLGFMQIYILDGGIIKWKPENLDLE